MTKVDIKNAEWLCPADVNEGSKAPTDGSADDDNKMKNRMQRLCGFYTSRITSRTIVAQSRESAYLGTCLGDAGSFFILFCLVWQFLNLVREAAN